jgi:hypothetical protein
MEGFHLHRRAVSDRHEKNLARRKHTIYVHQQNPNFACSGGHAGRKSIGGNPASHYPSPQIPILLK